MLKNELNLSFVQKWEGESDEDYHKRVRTIMGLLLENDLHESVKNKELESVKNKESTKTVSAPNIPGLYLG